MIFSWPNLDFLLVFRVLQIVEFDLPVGQKVTHGWTAVDYWLNKAMWKRNKGKREFGRARTRKARLTGLLPCGEGEVRRGGGGGVVYKPPLIMIVLVLHALINLVASGV